MRNSVADKRKEAGLSQEELAKRANVSRPYLSKVETGDAEPTVKKAGAIASALGCKIDDLFGPEPNEGGEVEP